jgi:hypothetical protein
VLVLFPALRGVYTKHKFCVLLHNLCHPTRIWSDDTRFGRMTQILCLV